MLIGMIKTKNDDDEAMTKGWFREAMREAMGEFAVIVNKSFVGVESRMGRIESRMGSVESTMAKQEDLLALIKRLDKFEKYTENRFDDVYRELKNIREDIKRIDARAEILDLQIRVTKLEKKTSL